MAEAYAIVAAPDRAPVAHGLFSVLTFRDSGRWLNGVTWEGTTCGPASVYEVGCTDGPIELNRPERLLEWARAEALSVEGTFQCSPVGLSLADIEDRAVADLQRHEEAAVEASLWDRLITDADAVELTPLTGSPKSVLGALEHHAALQYGTQGVIHLPRHLAPHFESLLESRGGRLSTFLGTPVVAGAGYGDPAGTTVAVSPALLAYRGEAQLLGDAELMFDRTQNLMTAVAQRDYLLGIDTCPIATATVTVTP